jgi:hypothetical protein
MSDSDNKVQNIKTCNKELSEKVIDALDLDITDMKVTGARTQNLIKELSSKEKKELFSSNRFESNNSTEKPFEGTFLNNVTDAISNNNLTKTIISAANEQGLADFQLMTQNRESGSTAMHNIAANSSAEVFSYALESVGDKAPSALKQKDHEGNTPLHKLPKIKEMHQAAISALGKDAKEAYSQKNKDQTKASDYFSNAINVLLGSNEVSQQMVRY